MLAISTKGIRLCKCQPRFERDLITFYESSTTMWSMGVKLAIGEVAGIPFIHFEGCMNMYNIELSHIFMFWKDENKSKQYGNFRGRLTHITMPLVNTLS